MCVWLNKDVTARLHVQLQRVAEEKVFRQRFQFQRLVERLDVLSPSVLARGYSLTTRHQQVVMGIEQVSSGDEIDVRVQNGVIHAILSTKAQMKGRNANVREPLSFEVLLERLQSMVTLNWNLKN